MMTTQGAGRARDSRARPFTPGYVLGGLAFGGSLWLSVWLVAQVVAPKILGSTSVTNLQHGVDLIATLMVLASFVAGLVGGGAGAWQAGRDHRRARRAVILHGVAGPFGVAWGFVAVAWVRHQATPLRSTSVDLALVLAGALVGALLMHKRRRLALGPSQVGLIGATTLVALLAVAPSATRADPARSTYQDIRASDCTVWSTEESLAITVTVASIDLGGQFGFSEERTRDGNWSVTVSYGATGGFTLAEGDRLGKLLGARLSVSTSGHLTLTRYNTYDAQTVDDADSIVKWAVGPYLADVAALPGVGSLVGGALRPGGDRSPPAPHSTELGLDGVVHLEFAAAAGTVNLDSQFELGSGVAVELANQSNRDPRGVSDPTEITVGLDLKTLLSSRVDPSSLEFDGDGEMTLKISRQNVAGVALWIPDTVALATTLTVAGTGTAEGDLVKLAKPAGGAEEAATSEATSRFIGSLRKADVEFDGGPNVVVGIISQVTDLLEHPRTLSALVGYFEAIGPAFEGKSVSQQDLDRASRRFARSFASDADIAITGVVGTHVTGKFELLMGDVIAFGLDAEAKGEIGLLVGALYRNATDGLAGSRTCQPDSQPGS